MEESKNSIFKSPLTYSIFFAIVVSLLGYYFISYKKTTINESSLDNNQKVIVKTTNEVDSDKDGLPDWKEVVYGSDPSNKDTDGDGMLDGAEISIGHDPTKRGPDDILHNLSLGNSTSTMDGDAEKTFVSEFMSKEIENIGSETVTGMVKSFDSTQIKPRYNLRDLNVISDNSPVALREYANSFGVIIKKYLASEVPDEAKIISDALKSKKETDLQKIELPAITYRNFSEDLRKIPVPSILAEHHLNAVSAYDVMSRSLFVTEKLFSNPVAGSAGWQMYLSQIVTVSRGYAGIINVLHDKNIIFDSTEPGYHFRWRGTATQTPPQIKTSTTTN